MMLRKLLPIALCLAAALTPQAGEADRPALRRLVLAIGANDGGTSRQTLRYANSDAAAVAKVMSELGGVGPGDTIVVTNASRTALLHAVEQLTKRVRAAKHKGERTEVLVYFSGHSDEEGLMLGQKRLGYKDVRRIIERIPADVRIAVVDSCASGALTRTKGGKRVAPFLIDTSTNVTGQAFLTSSSEDELAQESDRVQGSFFTHFLVSGLRGAADSSRDGKVTLNEAYRYAYDETLARTERTRSGPQHAAYDIQLAGTGDLVMTDIRATSARLVLASELHGRVFVRDDKRRLAAELRKIKGTALTLGLAPGRYTVTAELDDGVFGAQVALAKSRRTRLRRADLAKVSLEHTVARGSRGPETVVIEETTIIEPLGPGEDQLVWVPFNASLIPPIAINRDRDDVVNSFALNLLAGYGDALVGMELGVGANLRGSSVRGAQLAVGANVVYGQLDGAQLSWVYNQATRAAGFQFAGVANVAKDNLSGMQIAGVYNHTIDGRGVQIGGVNGAYGQFQGAQIGFLNIGGNIQGVQIGLVNYAENVDAPIGLLNIVTQGLNHVSVFTSDLNALNVGLRLGGRYFYNWLTVGFQPHIEGQWSMGLGIGGHVPISERFFINFDASAHKVTSQRWDDLHLLTRLRVAAGYRFLPRLAVVAGVTGNVLASFDNKRVDGLGYGAQFFLEDSTDVNVSIWPGFFLGLEI